MASTATPPESLPAHEAVTEAAFHRLRSIRIIGGFLDGAHLEFASGLNCMIGARGTGKTTVLELVRFVLDALPSSQLDASARRRIESLVEQNLGGGHVELEIETKDGLRYRVNRAVGEDPIVTASDGSPTNVQLKSGSFFKADIFSQNEVESIADRSLSQLALIDDFERDAIRTATSEIDRVQQSLATNAGRIVPLRDQIASLRDELGALPEVQERLKGYADGTGEADEPVNKAHEVKSLRDREKRAIEWSGQALLEQRQQLHDLVGQLATRTKALFTPELATGPNAESLARASAEMTDASSEIDNLLDEGMRRIDRAKRVLDDVATDLEGRHNQQELEFRQVIEQHEAAQKQATERSRLERLRNELLAKQRQLDDLKKQHESLLKERSALAQELSDLRDRRFQARQAIVDQINGALSPTIRVSLIQSGDPQPYLEALSEMLRGTRVRHNVVAQKLVNAFWPADLVAVIRQRNRDRMVDEAELNAEQIDRVIEALSDSPQLFDLEAVELLDSPRIELKDGDEYKDSTTLSTGQKCTTILPILLLDSDNPLLVDQPEDNLDNRFIYECVVESIRTTKSRRQLIFVTHNPNIPVLGDAERVFVLDSDGASGRILDQGSVDDCKDQIVTLLEGGEEAFKERRRRYSY